MTMATADKTTKQLIHAQVLLQDHQNAQLAALRAEVAALSRAVGELSHTIGRMK
jgi:glycine cleavage system regulatory protein